LGIARKTVPRLLAQVRPVP
jgi:transposase